MRRSDRFTPGGAFRRFVVMILIPTFLLVGTMGAGCDLNGFKTGSVDGLSTGLTTIFSGLVGASDPTAAFSQGATELFAGVVDGFFTGFWSDDIASFEENGSQK